MKQTNKKSNQSNLFEVHYLHSLMPCPLELITRVRAGCADAALRHVETNIPGAVCLGIVKHTLQ